MNRKTPESTEDALVAVLQDYLTNQSGNTVNKHSAEAVHLLQGIRDKQRKAALVGGIVADYCGCDEKFALAGLEFLRELSGTKNAKMRAFIEEVRAPRKEDDNEQPTGSAAVSGDAGGTPPPT